MNENLELMEYLYKNSEMGVHTLTKLLKELNERENKIKVLVETHLKEYEKFLKESKRIIKKNKLDVKENTLMTKMGSNMGIKMEVMKDNSDASIAHMIIEGVTMGIVDIETKIKNFKDKVNPDILQIAKDYDKTLNNQIKQLKEYL